MLNMLTIKPAHVLALLFLLITHTGFAQSDTSKLTDYEARYAQGNRSSSFLKQYIVLLDSLKRPVNEQLLDDYVGTLQVNDLDNFETLHFLLRQGPIWKGKTAQLIYLNQTLIDSLFHKLPLTERIAINRKITHQSFEKAVREKNKTLATQLSAFIYNTWKKENTFLGSLAQERNMLKYYEKTGDTSTYLARAQRFYNQYYSYTTPDSLFQTILLAQHHKRYYSPWDSITRHFRDSIWQRVSASKKRANQTAFAHTLHQAAASFARLGATNEMQLYSCLRWVQAAIKWNPNVPEYYHTFASILHALTFYDEAIAREQQAIDLAQKQGKDAVKYQEQLEKLRLRTGLSPT